jgi:hypothetical protein
MATRGVEQWIASLRATRASQQEPTFSPGVDTSRLSPWLLEIKSLHTSVGGDLSQTQNGERMSPFDKSKLVESLASSQQMSIRFMLSEEIANPNGSLPKTSVGAFYLKSCQRQLTRTNIPSPSGGLLEDTLPADGLLTEKDDPTAEELLFAPTPINHQNSNKGSPLPDFTLLRTQVGPQTNTTLQGQTCTGSSNNSVALLTENVSPVGSLHSREKRSEPYLTATLLGTVADNQTPVEEEVSPEQSQQANLLPSVLLYLPKEATESWLECDLSNDQPPTLLKAELLINDPTGLPASLIGTVRPILMDSMDGSECDQMCLAALAPCTTSQLMRTNPTLQTGPSSITVSPSHSLASEVDQAILGTFGRTSIESLAKLNRQSYFSKTCPATSASGSIRSPVIFKQWVTKLRRDSLLRRKSALVTGENDSSFSRWATPRAEERCQYNSRDKYEALSLQVQRVVKLWLTANVPNGGRRVAEANLQRGYTPRGRKIQKPLGAVAVSVSSRLDQMETGAKSQDTSGLRLNPVFVGWLMGWLMGWPEPSGSGCLETEWSRFKQLMRSALFGLLSDRTLNAK